MDGGSEFKAEFRELCENVGIKYKSSLAYNPQSNAIIERVHQVLGNGLRTFDLDNVDLDGDDPFELMIASVTRDPIALFNYESSNRLEYD